MPTPCTPPSRNTQQRRPGPPKLSQGRAPGGSAGGSAPFADGLLVPRSQVLHGTWHSHPRRPAGLLAACPPVSPFSPGQQSPSCAQVLAALCFVGPRRLMSLNPPVALDTGTGHNPEQQHRGGLLGSASTPGRIFLQRETSWEVPLPPPEHCHVGT